MFGCTYSSWLNNIKFSNEKSEKIEKKKREKKKQIKTRLQRTSRTDYIFAEVNSNKENFT